MHNPGGEGRLAILLHAHMPYVEGHGTWPFGEEWLWEATAKTYLPLLEVLDRWPGRCTFSPTPVLLDQLEAPGVHGRMLSFLSELRPATHAADEQELSDAGNGAAARAVHESARDYARAAEQVAGLEAGGLGQQMASHATWASAATHAVLPLIATDEGVRIQVAGGVQAHRRRSGAWSGGLWLPECAHAGWLEPLLASCGVRATCVDLSGVDGADELPQPIATGSEMTLLPIDRRTIDLVWAPTGYPRAGAYRDSHNRTSHGHCTHSNDGTIYDADRAREQARDHARDFVASVSERTAGAGGGLCIFAIDAELLGSWWHEGVWWLAETLAEAERRGLGLVALDDVIDEGGPAARRALDQSSWGAGRDLSTWSGPAVADIAWRTRAAELRVLGERPSPDPDVLRELALLQSSDWAFMVSRRVAAPYGRRRFEGHLGSLDRLIASAVSVVRRAS